MFRGEESDITSELISKILEPYCSSIRSSVQLYWEVDVQKNISFDFAISVVL